MEFFVLGTSGMMPLPGRFLTSGLLRYDDGSLILFDCGEGTQVALRRQNLRWKKIDIILITHTHADHITGLPGLLMLSSQVDRDTPLLIIGPPKTKEYVETNRRVLDMYINYEIIVQEIDPRQNQIVFETPLYTIRSIPLFHRKPCVGYIFEEKPRPGIFHPEKALELDVSRGPLWAKLQRGEAVENGAGDLIEPSQVLGDQRKGRKLSYVTDTLYLDTISAEVSDSDLFVCEGMFENSLLQSATEKRHLTARQAANIAQKAGGVKQLGLTHYSPRYTNHELKKLREEAREVFPETILLKEKMHFTLDHED